METKLEDGKFRLEPSDWRWSASIVGLVKYFHFNHIEYLIDDDFIEFDSQDITKEKYLLFVEYFFKDFMHHKFVEDVLSVENLSDEQIKLVNNKLLGQQESNTVMRQVFKGVKFDGTNSEEVKKIINDNRLELIEKTYKNGRALYYNFCNENNLFSDRGSSCRIKGYYVDMGKKSKSVSYRENKQSFVYQDSLFFDFIPFAFSKTRESFFVNNNFTIEQLIKSNKDDLFKEEANSVRDKLFFKMQNSASFINYDVEIIKKERERDYFESIFVRKRAIKIFSQISEKMIQQLGNPCNAKSSERGQDDWLNIQFIVTERVLNLVKLDNLIEKLIKSFNNQSYLIYSLIKINQLIYGGKNMEEKQKKAFEAAQDVNSFFYDKKNKLRAYEKKLISALTLKDYDKVQEILLHLSSFTQIRMEFLVDLFEDFEKNKNLLYTFVNVMGHKEKVEKTLKGEKNG